MLPRIALIAMALTSCVSEVPSFSDDSICNYDFKEEIYYEWDSWPDEVECLKVETDAFHDVKELPGEWPIDDSQHHCPGFTDGYTDWRVNNHKGLELWVQKIALVDTVLPSKGYYIRPCTEEEMAYIEEE